MALFEHPPLETLASAKDRWTPLHLEHGRLEVDDSSVKWIGADGLLCRLRVATVSALILGPGTTVTHAAMKACAESNTPVCWTGADSLRFYSFGIPFPVLPTRVGMVRGMASIKTVTVHEAKTLLSRLPAEVEKGREVTICRGTQPVARISQRLPRLCMIRRKNRSSDLFNLFADQSSCRERQQS